MRKRYNSAQGEEDADAYDTEEEPSKPLPPTPSKDNPSRSGAGSSTKPEETLTVDVESMQPNSQPIFADQPLENGTSSTVPATPVTPAALRSSACKRGPVDGCLA